MIIGCGPGRRSLLTGEAESAVRESEVLYGSARLLAMFNDFTGETVSTAGNLMGALDDIARTFRRRRIGVLVSGDVGFHSFASSILGRIGRDNCRLHPGISSMQYAFSLLGLSWDDAALLSGHGEDLTDLERTMQTHAKVGILTDGRKNPADLFSGVSPDIFEGKRVFVLENLSYGDERVTRVSYSRMREKPFSPLAVVIVVDGEVYDARD
jgi:precorrin-6y C5,15-methyltransferase (decarboxylating) CbiE subunit